MFIQKVGKKEGGTKGGGGEGRRVRIYRTRAIFQMHLVGEALE